MYVVDVGISSREPKYKYKLLYSVHCTVAPTQVDKVLAELANLNHCALPFLSRAAVNLCWYNYTIHHLMWIVNG